MTIINKNLIEPFSPTLRKSSGKSPYLSPILSPSTKYRILQSREEVQGLEPIQDLADTNSISSPSIKPTSNINSSVSQCKVNLNKIPISDEISYSTNSIISHGYNPIAQSTASTINEQPINLMGQSTLGASGTFYEININELSTTPNTQPLPIVQTNNLNSTTIITNPNQEEELTDEQRLMQENRERILEDIRTQLARVSLFSNFTRYTIAYGGFGILLVMVTIVIFVIGFIRESETILFAGIVTCPVGFVMINHSIYISYRKSRRRIEYLHQQQERLENPEPIDINTIPSKLMNISIDIGASPPPLSTFSPPLNSYNQNYNNYNNNNNTSTNINSPPSISSTNLHQSNNQINQVNQNIILTTTTSSNYNPSNNTTTITTTTTSLPITSNSNRNIPEENLENSNNFGSFMLGSSSSAVLSVES